MQNLSNIMEQVQEVMKKENICRLNDSLRKEGKGGQIICTTSVINSPNRNIIIEKIRDFNNFNDSNDPHGEHDFGKVTVDGTDYFFKFDYYDKIHNCLSPDPSDATKTRRVMTIMEASEY